LMREAWRTLVDRVRDGCEVMIVGRPEIRGANLQDVLVDVERLLATAGVLG